MSTSSSSPSSSSSSSSSSLDALYTPATRNFETALVALNSLQSNAATIASWIASRRSDLTADLHEEMLYNVSALGVNLSSLSIIHVAGTKGKGSTCAFVDSILRASGHRIGLYTSPHLIDVRERIRVDGKIIDKTTFSDHFWRAWDKLAAARSEKFPKMPTFFRFLTLVALQIFEEAKLDACIMEVGIGGRADPTNIFDPPAVTGISSLGFDHMNVLGHTLPEIAFEKAGIMKRGAPAFTVEQPPDAMEVIKERANIVGAPLCVAPPFESYYPARQIKLGLNGDHQKANAAQAIALCNAWLASAPHSRCKPTTLHTPYIPSKNNYLEAFFNPNTHVADPPLPRFFEEGIAGCRWAGRAQTFTLSSHPNLTFYVDGAHTPESTLVCGEWFKTAPQEEKEKAKEDQKTNPTNKQQNFETSTNILVFYCGRGRAPTTLLTPLSTSHLNFDKAIFPTFNVFPNPTAVLTKANQNDNDPQWQNQVAQAWRELSGMEDKDCELFSSVADGVDRIKTIASQSPTTKVNVLVTGSLYLVGAVLQVCNIEV